MDPKLKKIISKNLNFVLIIISVKYKFYCSEEEVADEQEPEGEDLNSEDVSLIVVLT